MAKSEVERVAEANAKGERITPNPAVVSRDAKSGEELDQIPIKSVKSSGLNAWLVGLVERENV